MPTSLGLLLASLTSCLANGLAVLFAKDGHVPNHLEVEAAGMRRDTHPMVIEAIRLDIRVKGEGLNQERAAVALAAAERICPVWAMLRPETVITTVLEMEG